MTNLGQRKIIEVIKAFFDKLILPVVKTYPNILSEWRHLSNILSIQPLECSKIDHYIAILNSDKLNLFVKPFGTIQSSFGNSDKKDSESKAPRRDGDDRAQQYKAFKALDMSQQGSQYGQTHWPVFAGETNFKEITKVGVEDGRKKLVTVLQSFQSILALNQQRLEFDFKKEKRSGGFDNPNQKLS